ncbi:RHS repeat domain-containing protein [Streptomyces smyrnaeus]|uniref:RHS repeat domain-containing protein n=1 Tax=Streptomyces smyrnaeus TaxID=1387713 RepID=UPI0037875807
MAQSILSHGIELQLVRVTRTWTYSWNAQDRLISTTNPSGEGYLVRAGGSIARRGRRLGDG